MRAIDRKRRQTLLAGVGAALPRFGFAQERRYRVGWLATSDNRKEPYGEAFVQRLSELGLVESRNLSLIHRYSAGRLEKLPAEAAELTKQKPDLFFAGGTEANLIALKQASR